MQWFSQNLERVVNFCDISQKVDRGYFFGEAQNSMLAISIIIYISIMIYQVVKYTATESITFPV